MLDKLPVPCALLIWLIVGQGPTVLAIGVGCLYLLPLGPSSSCLSFLSSFSFSLRDSPIKTEILSQRVVEPKTTNQHKTFFGTGKTLVHEIRRPVCVQGSLPEYFAYHIEHFSKNFKTKWATNAGVTVLDLPTYFHTGKLKRLRNYYLHVHISSLLWKYPKNNSIISEYCSLSWFVVQ